MQRGQRFCMERSCRSLSGARCSRLAPSGRITNARRPGAGPLQGGGLEGRRAARCDRPRRLVVGLQRSGARRPGKADRHLEPEPQSRRGGVPAGGMRSSRRPAPAFSRPRSERGRAALAQRRWLQQQHGSWSIGGVHDQLVQHLRVGELDAGSVGQGPPHRRERCRERAGERRRSRQRAPGGAGHARQRLSATARWPTS